jgi:YggT family protein
MPYTIYLAVKYLIDLLELAVFLTVIISWLPIQKDNRFIRILYQITEPVLAPIRNLLHRSAFTKNLMIDFSPVIAILLLELLKSIVYYIVARF